MWKARLDVVNLLVYEQEVVHLGETATKQSNRRLAWYVSVALPSVYVQRTQKNDPIVILHRYIPHARGPIFAKCVHTHAP